MSFHSYLSRKLFWFQDFTQGGVIWREYKDIKIRSVININVIERNIRPRSGS